MERLNFVVDDQLVVKRLSNENMPLYISKQEMVGSHIMEKLPLSLEDKKKINVAFSEALATQETQAVVYSLDSHSKESFVAEITPLSDALEASAGFFVKVTPHKA